MVRLLPLLFILSVACGSPFQRKEMVFSGDHAAFYKLRSDIYPSEKLREEMPPQVAYPELTEDQIARIFAAITYERDGVWGITRRRVYYNEELPDIAERFKEITDKLDENSRIVLITRHDSERSVLSRMERTSAIIWFDEAGFNIVLGEIRQEIPHNDLLERQEWLKVLPVSMRRSYNDLALLPSPVYSLKKVRGQTHKTWAVIPIANLDKLPPVPPNDRLSINAETPGGDLKPLDSKLQPTGDKKPENKMEMPLEKQSDKSEMKPEQTPAEKTDGKTELKPETKPEMKPETKVEAKPESKPEQKPEPKSEEKSGIKEDRSGMREGQLPQSSEKAAAEMKAAEEKKQADQEILTRKLSDLKQTLEQGLITQEEYDTRRKQLLESFP